MWLQTHELGNSTPTWHDDCLHNSGMNVGLAVSSGRVAPCLPGAELWVVSLGGNREERKTVTTVGWHPLAWPRELMMSNVDTLLCSGIDQFLWGALHGYGIEVVPEAVGHAEEVLEQWRCGRLAAPRVWPPSLRFADHCRGGRRQRFRNGWSSNGRR